MLLCMIFAICMLMPMGARAEEEGTQGTKVLNQITLSVGDEQKTPVYKAGEKAELKINVLNKGNMDAQNVTIAPVISSTDEWPFDMEQLNYEQSLGTIPSGSKMTATWGGGDDKLTVRSDVTGKSYKLTFRLTYDDGEKLSKGHQHPGAVGDFPLQPHPPVPDFPQRNRQQYQAIPDQNTNGKGLRAFGRLLLKNLRGRGANRVSQSARLFKAV